MNKKEELKRLLKEFTKDELMEILEASEEETEKKVHEIDPTKKKRRRGKGTRRKNKKEGSQKRSTKTYGNDKGNSCRSGAVNISSKRPNKFDDFMKNTVLTAGEKNELKEASVADSQNKNLDRAPRTRRSDMVEAECRSCGVQEEVSSSVIYDIKRWKCNKCSSQACD